MKEKNKEKKQEQVVDLRKYSDKVSHGEKGDASEPNVKKQEHHKSEHKGAKEKTAGATQRSGNRKRTLLVIALILVIVGSGTASAFFLFYKKPASQVATTDEQDEKEDEESKLVAGMADGVLQDAATAHAFPYTVMIENLSSIRPQTGLSKASVVYEAVAEGGITRFLAVFQGKELDKIGPVRSARNYYMDWAEEFHGLFIHAGGSPTALAAIRNYDFTDLNALTSDGKYFWRDRSESAPHNLYTKTSLLSVAARDKKTSEVASFNSWQFKDDTGSWIGKTKADVDATDDAAKVDEIFRQATDITLEFSSVAYRVNWKYDQEKNEYARFNGSQAHTDRATGEQLKFKNVAVAKVRTSALDDKRLTLDTAAGGAALIFHDGVVIEGTWKKPARSDRMRFFDEDEKEIEFTRGATWVEMISPDKKITY